jgi:HD-GYP domain-containing protein (c-di-GMP phosphodiesterase class II)
LSKEVLNKPGKLNDSEWIEVKRHSEKGYLILGSVNNMALHAKYVLHHHEHWDGSGYPSGLKGEQIPLQARIIGIADAYDAMTSTRSYRKVFNKEEAIREIEKYSGTQFDPDIARLFIDDIIGRQ